MGNNDSKPDRDPSFSSVPKGTSVAPKNSRLENFWITQLLTGEDRTYAESKDFETVFGHQLGPLIFAFLKRDTSNIGENAIVTEDEFYFGGSKLVGTSHDSYIQLFFAGRDKLLILDLKQMVQMCRAAAKVHFVYSNNPEKSSKDEQFLEQIARAMLDESSNGSDFEFVKRKTDEFCPRLFVGLQKTVSARLTGDESEIEEFSLHSNVVSPFEMWFVQCCLPLCYVSPANRPTLNLDASSSASSSYVSWDLLFSSSEHGLSASRFESKVLGYKGSTVVFVELLSGQCYCIAVDESWRFGTQRWGKSSCIAFELCPELKILSQGSQTMYFNVKQRGFPQALTVGSNPKLPVVDIKADFSQVSAMEVWGCANEDVLNEHKKQKQWEQKQVEKQKKVPLPGNWDDNPDKFLLEMAGINVNHAENDRGT